MKIVNPTRVRTFWYLCEQMHRLKKMSDEEPKTQPSQDPENRPDAPEIQADEDAKTSPDAQEQAILHAEEVSGAKRKKKKKKKKKTSGITTSRGVETMFRSSYRVQMDLTALADSKANIMITINGLILSIILASISPKIDSNPFLVVPTTIVLLTCVISIVYAVLAAVPRVTSSNVTRKQVLSNQANLLFFGNFAGLRRSEFVDIMKEVLKEPDRVYHNMMNDLYGIGIVLKRKFHLLRISYVTFMIGIIVSVAAFVAVFIMQMVNGSPDPSTLPG